jgi:short-subunit dehydrogenase
MGAQEIGAKIIGVVVSLFRVLYWYVEALYRKIVPPPMKPIDNETILVTGAAGGIGKEICRYIVKCGTNLKLVIWDLHQTDLEKLAGELKTLGASGLKVFPMAVDISSRENIEKACQQVKDTAGSATIIFNNAGIADKGNFLQLTTEQIERTIQVNLMSHLWIIRQFLPEMVAMNHGRIVNICSMGGLKAATGALPYFASKFGVNGYTEALKAELYLPANNRYEGIRLSTVYPYFVQTPLIQSLSLDDATKKSLPGMFQNFLTPQEVAKKAVDGMRREYEYIYVPGIIPLIVLLDFLLPLKFSRAMEAGHLSSFVFKDKAEHERILNTPYLAPPGAANGKAKKVKSR